MSDEPVDWPSWADVSERLPMYTPLTFTGAVEVTSALAVATQEIEGLPLGGVFASLTVLFDPAAPLRSKGEAVANLMHLARADAVPASVEPMSSEALEAVLMIVVRELHNSNEEKEAVRAIEALRPDPGRVQEVIDYAEQLGEEDPGPLGGLYHRSAQALRGLLDPGASSRAPSTDER
jgi:hypothetical protein